MASMTGAARDAYDTIPKLLLRNAQVRGDRPAIREKDLGIWQTWTWAQVRDEVRALALGLKSLGLRKHDKIGVIGDNRPQLYWTMVAAQTLGAIPVPVYQDAPASELQYVVDHAGLRFVVAEDQEQVDKMLEIKQSCPGLEQIIYDDTRGMRDYGQDFLHEFAGVQAKGRALHQDKPAIFDELVNNGCGSDTAIILYTSGTTGRPKGVILSMDNCVIAARNGVAFDGLTDEDESLAYLPIAWVGDNVFSLGESHVAGFCINCPESGATVMHDMKEIGPTFFFAPPRIFENVLTTVMIRIEDAGWIKRNMFHYFMGVARRSGIKILEGRPVSVKDRLLYGLGRIFVYSPLLNALGFSRIRLAYTAGEAIGPDIFDFFRSLGMNLKQLYGQTEATIFVTQQPDGAVKPDTVGIASPGVELKIDETTREVLYRSPGVFQEYYKDPEATRNTKTENGWVHTGDAGFIGSDGQLRIIDRAKDVGKLRNGQMFAPKYIENKLKFFPFIKEAVAFGDGRDEVTAIISIDLEAVGNWAERNAIAYASYQELAALPQVYDMIRQNVERVNRDLASDPNLSGSQIARFVLLHKELDADDGELTRTRKVRRNFVAEKYHDVIAALASGQNKIHVETEVRFEDGRKGLIAADLRICDVPAGPSDEVSSAAQ